MLHVHLFPKQCGHTEGSSRSELGPGVPSTCSRVSQKGGPAFFSKLPHTIALVKSPCAFRLRRLAQNMLSCWERVRHFFCKFPHKSALVKCPCAFRLRRLAQNVGRAIGDRHFSCKFSAQTGSCELSMCVSIAHPRTTSP